MAFRIITSGRNGPQVGHHTHKKSTTATTEEEEAAAKPRLPTRLDESGPQLTKGDSVDAP